MIDILKNVLDQWRYVLPIVFVLLFHVLINLKRKNRCYQLFIPVLTLIYVYVLFFKGNDAEGYIRRLLSSRTSFKTTEIINYTVVVILAILLYYILKLIFMLLFKKIFSRKGSFYGRLIDKIYEFDQEDEIWYLAERWVQGRDFLKVMYISIFILSVILTAVSYYAFEINEIDRVFYLWIPVLLFGEVYNFFNGLAKSELGTEVEGEGDAIRHKANYALLRVALRNLFGDKVSAENTTVSLEENYAESNEAAIQQLIDSEDTMTEAYGIFMKSKLKNGLPLKQNYLQSGLMLLKGKSLLLNNPFYYDLIPYIFFAMNHVLLRHKKVLIILGRHGVEKDVVQWCEKGIAEVTGNPFMWEIGQLTEDKVHADIGIITRSEVCNQAMHEKNADFLEDTQFVVILEPSRLITTAQIGLNSIVKHCSVNDEVTFCSMDKNCDGLVDALSHILQTSITEVTATDHHTGISSYMCWNADEEHLQHRMLPGIARYLGIGSELSFVALKNQVVKTYWYGGEAFPVTDMHWILKQYYYPLLKYAELPTTQEYLDKAVNNSANLWNARVKNYHYLTVEDESNNVFEARRLFASRAKEQGFVNIISTNYLLREYMTANEKLFDSDSKAIPYIVADYDRTLRNVLMRILLRMSGNGVEEPDLVRELMLVGIHSDHIFADFWEAICQYFGTDPETFKFNSNVILKKRKFSKNSETLNTVYYLTDSRFKQEILGGLQNVSIIAEDERGNQNYLGAEVKGQIFQKYLPGQYFVFDGKYYEMIRVTDDDQMLVRRAADHIFGREQYRQVRHYKLENINYSQRMGDAVSIGGIKLQLGYADIDVETKAYWRMKVYNDFNTAEEVVLDNMPNRTYVKKRFLRMDFANARGYEPGIIPTLTILMNELFTTIFAGNQHYLVAVSQEEVAIPDLYTIEAEGEHADSVIYIIEDSQLDIGLLTAMRRNGKRIFTIICDYLEWQSEYYPDEAEEILAAPALEEVASGVEVPENTENAPDVEITEITEETPEEETVEITEEAPEAEPVETTEETPEAAETTEEAQVEITEVEADGATKVDGSKRERYLCFGGAHIPEQIHVHETIAFLKGLNYANNELLQARFNQDLSAELPMVDSGHSCDFCGRLISGVDYEILHDGRERCMVCSRSAIRSEKEFARVFFEVKENMELLFGISFKNNIKVKMVNAERLNKRANHRFIPTDHSDARVVGLAIKDGKDFTLLIENGAPRIQSMLTIAHELTHIWQYQNWKQKKIKSKYGKNCLEIYEGMASWVEVQYAYLINEPITGRRKHMELMLRDDAYGNGFKRFVSEYPISETTQLSGKTPFMAGMSPLDNK